MKTVTTYKVSIDIKSPNLERNLELIEKLSSQGFLSSDGFLQYEDFNKGDLMRILNDYDIKI